MVTSPGKTSLKIRLYRAGARLLVRLLYRPRFTGFEHIPAEGGAIIVCNHVSYMDGMILHAASPRPLVFVIAEQVYRQPFVTYFLDLNGVVPITATKKGVREALGQISQILRAGGIVVVFPEGTITRTGNMGRFRPGIEWMLAADKVPVIPVIIEGLWGSIFSRKYLGSRLRYLPRRLFRRVTAICGTPVPPEQASVGYLQRAMMKLANTARGAED